MSGQEGTLTLHLKGGEQMEIPNVSLERAEEFTAQLGLPKHVWRFYEGEDASSVQVVVLASEVQFFKYTPNTGEQS